VGACCSPPEMRIFFWGGATAAGVVSVMLVISAMTALGLEYAFVSTKPFRAGDEAVSDFLRSILCSFDVLVSLVLLSRSRCRVRFTDYYVYNE
jgi:hypothetical protein